MTRKIDLTFRITCRECGHETSLEGLDIGEDPLHCSGCGHPFSLSHTLALTVRRRVEEFLEHLPETED